MGTDSRRHNGDWPPDHTLRIFALPKIPPPEAPASRPVPRSGRYFAIFSLRTNMFAQALSISAGVI